MSRISIQDALLVPVLIALAIALFPRADGPVDYDDAYISYRFAHNLANGHGAVYNPGEHIYGSTTLLWVGVLAACANLSGAPVDAVSRFLAWCLMPVHIALIYWLLRRCGSPGWLAGGGCLLLLAAPMYLLIMTAGMETPLYVALQLATLVALVHRRLGLMGVLCGLTFATRPDGLAILPATLGAAALVKFAARTDEPLARQAASFYRSAVLPALFGFALIAIPFLLFCWGYYGSLLPHTFSAKRHHVMIADRYWMLQHFLNGPAWPALAAIAVACWISLAPRRPPAAVQLSASLRQTATDLSDATPSPPVDPRLTHQPVWIAAALWLLLYVVAWTWARIDMYPWYLAAAAPACVLALLWPMTLLQRFSNPLLRWGVPLAALGLILTRWGPVAAREHRGFLNYCDQMEIPRREVGRLLHQRLAGDQSIGVGAIGLIGYFSPGHRVIDYAGLVTPRSVLQDRRAAPTVLIAENREQVAGCLAFAQIPADVYAPVHMLTPRVQGPDQVVWLRRDRRASWTLPSSVDEHLLGIRFGEEVELVSLESPPLRARRGQPIVLQPRWRFDAPLPAEKLICYYLGNAAHPQAAYVDTRGLFRNRRPYSDVDPADVLQDCVEIPTGGLPPGVYELTAMVYPIDGFEPPEPKRSRVHPLQARLLEVEILP